MTAHSKLLFSVVAAATLLIMLRLEFPAAARLHDQLPLAHHMAPHVAHAGSHRAAVAHAPAQNVAYLGPAAGGTPAVRRVMAETGATVAVPGQQVERREGEGHLHPGWSQGHARRIAAEDRGPAPRLGPDAYIFPVVAGGTAPGAVVAGGAGGGGGGHGQVQTWAPSQEAPESKRTSDVVLRANIHHHDGYRPRPPHHPHHNGFLRRRGHR